MLRLLVATALSGFPRRALQDCVPDPDTPAYKIGRESVQKMAAAAAQVTPIEKAFMAVPSNESAYAHLKHITSKPHVAATPGDHEMAEYVRDLLDAAGFDAAIDLQRTLLSYPVSRSLELIDESGRVVHAAPLAEAILPSDPSSDTWYRNHTFLGYSPSGNATVCHPAARSQDLGNASC